MAHNREAALLFGDMPGDQRDRDIDIDQQPAPGALDMVVAVDPLIVATRLIGEGQLLNETALGQQVERAVDRAVGDLRIPAADALKDIACRQVTIGHLDRFQNGCPLRCIAVGGSVLYQDWSSHCSSTMPVANESRSWLKV
jgi:hypothetical protein